VSTSSTNSKHKEPAPSCTVAGQVEFTVTCEDGFEFHYNVSTPVDGTCDVTGTVGKHSVGHVGTQLPYAGSTDLCGVMVRCDCSLIGPLTDAGMPCRVERQPRVPNGRCGMLLSECVGNACKTWPAELAPTETRSVCGRSLTCDESWSAAAATTSER
jgi:hypothetical protein